MSFEQLKKVGNAAGQSCKYLGVILHDYSQRTIPIGVIVESRTIIVGMKKVKGVNHEVNSPKISHNFPR